MVDTTSLCYLPIALAATLLLGATGIGVRIAGFAKVAWKVLFRGSGAVCKTDVVAIVGLLSASH